MWSLDYVLCASIDIGETFSSYGYSYSHSPNEVKINEDWGVNLGRWNNKAPTAVLVDDKRNFVAFGYTAVEKLKQMDTDTAKKYLYFERFKMKLFSSTVSGYFIGNHCMVLKSLFSQSLSLQTKVRATNGEQMTLFEILAMSIEYLKDHLLKMVNKTRVE